MRSFLRGRIIRFFFGRSIASLPPLRSSCFLACYLSAGPPLLRRLARCRLGPARTLWSIRNATLATEPTIMETSISSRAASLIFDEKVQGVNINFWAKGILIENGGSLTAGSPAAPFGSMSGTLTIHLYGADQLKQPQHPGHDPWVMGVGIQCKIAPQRRRALRHSTDDAWDKGRNCLHDAGRQFRLFLSV